MSVLIQTLLSFGTSKIKENYIWTSLHSDSKTYKSQGIFGVHGSKKATWGSLKRTTSIPKQRDITQQTVLDDDFWRKAEST